LRAHPRGADTGKPHAFEFTDCGDYNSKTHGHEKPDFRLMTAGMANRPVLLLTNDDGIHSAGLWAAAEALSTLGDVTVVTPGAPSSGTGRSHPGNASGRIEVLEKTYGGETRKAYAVDGTPAQAVLFGLLEILPAPPALVVAGINFGENVGLGITVSGTIGATLEAAAAGVRALAVSLEMPLEQQAGAVHPADFSASARFTERFARALLKAEVPPDVWILKVDVPSGATADTPWRLTRLSRNRYYVPEKPVRKSFSDPVQIPYRIVFDPRAAEEGSDVHAVRVERIVSVTPLSLDFTSRVDADGLESALRGAIAR
jgi:5'-nucleotidase